MSIALALSAAEGEGAVDAGGVANMVDGDGFGVVGGVCGEDKYGDGVYRSSSDGDDALRRQLLSEFGERSV